MIRGTHAATYPSYRALTEPDLPVAAIGICTLGSRRTHVSAVASESFSDSGATCMSGW